MSSCNCITGEQAKLNKQKDLPRVLVVANKAEGAHLSDALLDTLSDSMAFGFGEPVSSVMRSVNLLLVVLRYIKLC